MINDTIEEVGGNHTTLADAGCNGEPFRQVISDTNTAFTVGVEEFYRRQSFGGVPEMRMRSQRDMRSMLSKAALKSTNAMYNVRFVLCCGGGATNEAEYFIIYSKTHHSMRRHGGTTAGLF